MHHVKHVTRSRIMHHAILHLTSYIHGNTSSIMLLWFLTFLDSPAGHAILVRGLQAGSLWAHSFGSHYPLSLSLSLSLTRPISLPHGRAPQTHSSPASAAGWWRARARFGARSSPFEALR